MSYALEYSKKAKKQLDKLDDESRKRIVSWMRDNVKGCDNPRLHGRTLTGKRDGGYWRYRVGDYRIVCDIQDGSLVVLAIRIEHRSEVYTQRRHER